VALRLKVVLFRIRTSIRYFPLKGPCAFIDWLVHQSLWANTSFAKNHKCGVDTDSREPCSKAGASVEISKVNKGIHNSLLERILGIFSILCNSGESEENAPGVAIAELNEC